MKKPFNRKTKPASSPAGWWVVGAFIVVFTGVIICLFDIPKRVGASVAKIHFELPSKAAPIPIIVKSEDNSVTFRKFSSIAKEMSECGKSLLGVCMDTATRNEKLRRARYKSKQSAKFFIEENEAGYMTDAAVGYSYLVTISQLETKLSELPPPTEKWKSAYGSLCAMQNALNLMAKSCDLVKSETKQRHFEGIEKDAYLDDPECFPCNIDTIENLDSTLEIIYLQFIY